jgi:transcriptional antiterminator RfaH
MSYWAVARLEPRREQLALRCLGLAGHETYFRGCVSIGSYTDAGSKSGRRSFRVIVPHRRQWYAARWSLGVIGLIMDGVRPARVADQVIDDLRKRERNGLIEPPQRSGLKPGDQVRILQGSFAGQLGLYAGVRAHERMLVLLALLGGQQRVELPKADVEAVSNTGRAE